MTIQLSVVKRSCAVGRICVLVRHACISQFSAVACGDIRWKIRRGIFIEESVGNIGKNSPRRRGDTEQTSLIEFIPMRFAIGINSINDLFWRKSGEHDQSHHFFRLQYMDRFVKLDRGGMPLSSLTKPPVRNLQASVSPW